MPANGRRDIIRRVKVNVFPLVSSGCATPCTGQWHRPPEVAKTYSSHLNRRNVYVAVAQWDGLPWSQPQQRRGTFLVVTSNRPAPGLAQPRD
jgi:hypothetical protein